MVDPAQATMASMSAENDSSAVKNSLKKLDILERWMFGDGLRGGKRQSRLESMSIYIYEWMLCCQGPEVAKLRRRRRQIKNINASRN